MHIYTIARIIISHFFSIVEFFTMEYLFRRLYIMEKKIDSLNYKTSKKNKFDVEESKYVSKSFDASMESFNIIENNRKDRIDSYK